MPKAVPEFELTSHRDFDHTMFILNVDLWSGDGTREVNLVRSSQGTQSISATQQFSYSALSGGDSSFSPSSVAPPTRDMYAQQQPMDYGQDYQHGPSGYGTGMPDTIFTPISGDLMDAASPYPSGGSYAPPQQFFPHQQNSMTPYGGTGLPTEILSDDVPVAGMAVVGSQPSGMFTRNLIGSLVVSAFRLNDTTGKIGIWFVLQDLSVRTEGFFRYVHRLVH